MPQPPAKPWLIMSLIFVLLAVTTPSAAQESPKPDKADETNETLEAPDSAGMMLMDAFMLRPLGLAATVLGTAAFVVTLPFSLPTRSADDAAKALVVKPARYTFARPLGEVDP